MVKPHPALARLEVLVGRWGVQPAVDGVAPAWSRFTWAEDGAFLRQYTDRGPRPPSVADPWEGHAPYPTVGLIGLDDSADEFTMLYADARGVSRVYRMAFTGREWTMVRRAEGFHQRYFATVREDGDRIDGRWEMSEDGEDWHVDFELTYVRQS